MADLVTTALYKLVVGGVDEIKKADDALAKLTTTQDKASASATKMTDANKGLATSTAQVTVTETRGAAAKRSTTEAVDRWLGQMDKTLRAQQQYQAGLARIARYQEDGVISDGARSRALQLVTQRFKDQTQAANDNARAHGNLGDNVIQLGAGLLTGQTSLRLFTSQLRELKQDLTAQGGVSGALSNFGTSIKGMVTPTTAAIAAVVALGAAAVVLAKHIYESDQAVRQYDVTLRGMGVSTLATAGQLKVMQNELLKTGLSAEDAQKAIQGIVRAGLNPAAAGMIAQVGKDLGAATGKDGIEQLTTALKGGLEPTIALGLEIKALSAADVGLFRDMARGGEATKALDLAFQKIKKSVKDLNEDAMSPLQKATRDLNVAWNGFLDGIANTAPFKAAMQAITDLVNLAAAALNGDTGALGKLMKLLRFIPGVGAILGIGGEIVGAVAPAPAAPGGGTGAPGSPATAPIPSLAGVSPEFGAALQRMIADAAAQGITIGITSGLRTTERQAQLYAADVAAHGGTPSGMVAKPGSSLHEYGFAADLARDPAAIAFAHANAAKYGLNFPMAKEPWHIELAGARTGGGAMPSVTAPDPEKQKAVVDELNKSYARELEVLGKVGVEAEVARAKQEIMSRTDLDGEQKRVAIANAVAAARAKGNVEFGKELEAQSKQISGLELIRDGYAKSYAAGQRAEAASKAAQETFTKFGDLENHMVEAEKLRNQLLAEQRILQQTANNQQILAQKDSQQLLELQISLQGQSSDEITKQVSLLQAKQELDRTSPLLTEQDKNNRLAAVAATADLNKQLQETQRQQQRIDQIFIQIGETIASSITSAFESLFSGKKVEDWGKQLKTMLGSLTSQLFSSVLVRPAIGSILSSFGLGSAAQNFGSIGGTFSGLSNLFGGSGGGGQTVTNDKGDVIGTVTQGGGVLKSIFGGGEGGGGFLGNIGSSISSGFNNIGGFLGFANPGAASAGLPAGSAIGPTLPTGSLFGTTTLGGFLGGSAAGFGAGMFLNNILGGNQMGGTIGSAGGALAGAAIGSIVPGIGTLIGGLVGGAAGGGLGGLFGGTKKPDAASGGVINLATGQIVNAQSGGNAENDRIASQIGTALSAAVTRALAIPGARLPGGAVSIQAGSRDGIKLSFGGQEYKFGSAEAAIAAGLNALRDNLTGVSETVQKVIHSIGDPAQIEGALAFADAYEKLATAADDAFKEVEANTKTIGPFEAAMTQIRTLFDGLSQQAEQYGLSLEPINKSLEEATRRLNVDFAKAVDTAFNAATGRDFLTNVQAIIDGYEQMARDASAIGAANDVHDKLGQTYIAELNTAFAQLTGPQLDEVIAQFGNLSGVLPDLARAAKAAADAAAALTRETDRQAAAYQIQQDADTAAGRGFLAQLRDLDKARKAAQANAASLDLGEGRQSVIAETEHRAALNILQGLTNDELEQARKTLADLNPAFAAWVDEAYNMIQASKDAATATQAQADAQARANAILQAGLQIRQYLNAQETGTDFTSPTSRLEAARGQFQTQLGLARGGDLTALQGITGIADQLKQALQGYFASAAPGAQEWEDVKAALASLPGVPNAQQTQTNAIVTAITEASTATVAGISDATSASAQSIIGTTVATNAAIVDNARSTARDIVYETGASSTRIVTAAIDTSNDIVQNGIASSARIVGATTTGLELATGATLTSGAQVAAAANNTATAVTYGTDVAKGGTLALLASNENNAKTLIAGSKEDTQNLLAQQEANAGALLNANAQQAAALTAQNELNARAVVNTTNATAASIVAQGNASTAQVIATATATTDLAVTKANDNTKDMIWTAQATSAEVAARNEASVQTLTATTQAGTDTLLAQTKEATATQVAVAQSTTNTSVAAAYDSTAQLGSRTEAASANVAATTKAGTDAIVARSDAQIAALQSLAGITVGDVQVATAIYNVGGWIVGDNAAWSNAIYQQIAAYSTWVVQSNGDWTLALINTVAAWGNSLNYTIWFMLDATIRTIRDWSNLINYTTWAGADAVWRTVDAWGNAVAGTIREWGNAICGTIAAWGNAEVGNANNNAVNIINMLAAVSNAIVSYAASAEALTISAIYGTSSNEIGAAFANGNAIIGAVGSMSVGNIAATFAAANSIVAQVAASGGGSSDSGAIYRASYDITFGINQMSNRLAGYLDNIMNQTSRAADLLQALFNMTAANFDQMHGELAAINDNSGKNARSIVGALGG